MHAPLSAQARLPLLCDPLRLPPVPAAASRPRPPLLPCCRPSLPPSPASRRDVCLAAASWMNPGLRRSGVSMQQLIPHCKSWGHDIGVAPGQSDARPLPTQIRHLDGGRNLLVGSMQKLTAKCSCCSQVEWFPLPSKLSAGQSSTLAGVAGGGGGLNAGFCTATLVCVSCESAVCWMWSNLRSHMHVSQVHRTIERILKYDAVNRVPVQCGAHRAAVPSSARSHAWCANVTQCRSHQRTRLTCCWTCCSENADTAGCAAAKAAKSATVIAWPAR